MQTSDLRRVFLWLFLACLGLTAVLAIGALLADSFGELQARVLATSASVSAASFCAMAGAAYRERGRLPWLGSAGIGLDVVALGAALVAIWSEEPGDRQVEVTVLIAVWAAAAAHAQLLTLPRLQASFGWVQVLCLAAIATLAALISFMVLERIDSEAMGRAIGIASIVVTLLTLTVPILWKIGGGASPTDAAGTADELALRRGIDGVWVDRAGVRYEVRRVDS